MYLHFCHLKYALIEFRVLILLSFVLRPPVALLYSSGYLVLLSNIQLLSHQVFILLLLLRYCCRQIRRNQGLGQTISFKVLKAFLILIMYPCHFTLSDLITVSGEQNLIEIRFYSETSILVFSHSFRVATTSFIKYQPTFNFII